jgi:hypothetical protein
MENARITDCHVNIWEDKHLLPAFAEQTASARPGSVGLRADAETLYRAMSAVERHHLLAALRRLRRYRR